MTELLNEMKIYAQKNHVPIIEDAGLAVIIKLIKDYNSKTILEIGTAIGFSALQMHLCNDADVTTIERDLVMYKKAEAYINCAKKADQIKLIFADALHYDTTQLAMYDLLYIDAAKGQYQKFFEKYAPFVQPGGLIVFDNLNFHGLVNVDPVLIESRNCRQLVKKIKAFVSYISTHPAYDFRLINAGDGIGVAMRKKA